MVFEAFIGLAVTAGLAPLVRAQMLRHGIMDIPNHRSSHSMPTPRAGGLACLGGTCIAMAVAELRGAHPWWTALAAVVVLALVGLADDRIGLTARTRLFMQVTVGVVLGFVIGGPVMALAGLFIVAASVNAVNFMDGINGITGFTMLVWGAATATAGLGAHSSVLASWGGVTAGVALGFLPFNVPVARMFLGDVGSYLFGALVGGGLMIAWHEGADIRLVAAPLAIYAMDTAWALARRASRGERLTDAHREHVYQRLTSDLGLSHGIVAFYAAALSALITVAWWMCPMWVAVPTSLLLCALYLASSQLMRLRRTLTSPVAA